MSWQQDLKAIKLDLARTREREARAAALQEKERRQANAGRILFQRAMADVTPLVTPRRVRPGDLQALPLPPIPRQRLLDEQAALQESLSDDFDAGTLLHTDEALSFRRRGIGPDVPYKLRRGAWAVQAEVDLHGLNRNEAREALAAFLAHAQAAGKRCVRVIHGKGLGSPGRVPVLKTRVPSWLIQKRQVLAFVQAPAPHGGAGALLVLLARSPRQIGAPPPAPLC